MNKPHAPEAAETVQTKEIPAVDLPRLVRQSQFRCASCAEQYIGEPILRNGCKLCADCRNAPLYTVEEIAKYIAGWTLGSFDEVKKLGQRVAHNALHQLRDGQDGIEACRQRENYLPNVLAHPTRWGGGKHNRSEGGF